MIYENIVRKLYDLRVLTEGGKGAFQFAKLSTAVHRQEVESCRSPEESESTDHTKEAAAAAAAASSVRRSACDHATALSQSNLSARTKVVVTAVLLYGHTTRRRVCFLCIRKRNYADQVLGAGRSPGAGYIFSSQVRYSSSTAAVYRCCCSAVYR